MFKPHHKMFSVGWLSKKWFTHYSS